MSNAKMKPVMAEAKLEVIILRPYFYIFSKTSFPDYISIPIILGPVGSLRFLRSAR